MMEDNRVSCGQDLNFSNDLNQNLNEAIKNEFDFICVPICNPRFQREFLLEPMKNRPGPITRSDFLLSSNEWTTVIVAKLSTWLQLDSDVEHVRINSECAFRQEIMFASHLGVPATMISLKNAKCVNLSRFLNEYAINPHSHLFWIRVPMKSAQDQVNDFLIDDGNLNSEIVQQDTWKWWDNLRTFCDSQKKLILVLELSTDLPSDEEIDRWLGEPVKVLIISTSLFLTNKKGFPVLSKSHQVIVKKFFKLNIQLVLTGHNQHQDKGFISYRMYLNHIYQNRDPPDNVSVFAKGYEDYLQCPLQPLMDNLESQTYEIFEKDPIKYNNYQQAIFLALLDLVKDEDKSKVIPVLMVLGAGRGPLVSAALRASEASRRPVKIYAVEKNPNAIITLENLKQDQWGDKVTIISSDMRFWQSEDKADIIISELLGSFGDNELSPECLYGAERFLKPGGISIPSSYTSYLVPLQSSKLWNEARLCRDSTKPNDSQFETPYVVRLHNSRVLGNPKPLFKYEHPRPKNNNLFKVFNADQLNEIQMNVDQSDSKLISDKAYIDSRLNFAQSNGESESNDRFMSLDFNIPIDTTLHGFGGYFHCILYADVTLSIVPDTHTPGMFSWFPIYFPIKEPVALNKDDCLTVNFWRLSNEKNVWYEWCISSPVTKPIHNPRGRSYTIGL